MLYPQQEYMIKEGKRVANFFFVRTIPASSESEVFLNFCFAHITIYAKRYKLEVFVDHAWRRKTIFATFVTFSGSMLLFDDALLACIFTR